MGFRDKTEEKSNKRVDNKQYKKRKKKSESEKQRNSKGKREGEQGT